ncbi:hypothetical protein KAFR_0C02000 [Kazachstania africana CBS 2517]|uniref:Uncharacterized protein n=1 Tax=Kazachstania africana (strain ATCC 22294 / BCRC 22015 / CBS 2517 / CECT 1963 / NBRC 1671 / NRRL Y-8276) TaxID=1071382 RepID=H2AS43_KAZAF|nr:hypothetical protein KAFR_0C02000 [Kazachstania africana CBS 2517]CCF57193.1 hypothetical protein KAFR_0C02000 [Kazachstania africana CBS 2517]
MAKKKRTKSFLHIETIDVQNSSSNEPTFNLVENVNTINDLSSLLGQNNEPSVLLEGLVISLFTTKSGHSILSVLNNPDANSELFQRYNSWLESSSGDLNYKYLKHELWQSNRNYYLSQFTKFLLQNEQVPFHLNNYHLTKYKLKLQRLINSESNIISLILNSDNYNLLLDFIMFFQPYMNDLISYIVEGNKFFEIIAKYNRIYELNGFHTWYTLTIASNTSIAVRYLNDVLSIDPMITDQFTSNYRDKAFQESEETLLMSQQQTAKDDIIFSFDLNETGDLPNLIKHSEMRHQIIYDILNLNQIDSPFLKKQFLLICGLVDPLTQPQPNNEHIISIDLIYQLFMGLMYKFNNNELAGKDKELQHFTICFNMQKIISRSLVLLNCNDYDTLSTILNDFPNDYKTALNKWLPHGINTQDLELIYMINIIAIYTIYKLYSNLPIQLNPFLQTLVSLWKTLSHLVLIGLEIDRIEESNETYDTPIIVRATIRGAAALRAVIATILNDHVSTKEHDFKHESFNTFMSPHGRKLCSGALLADLRSHAAAILALGDGELHDVTELLADLQAGDRFDEDVKYIFEYEYQDYNELGEEDEQTNELEELEKRSVKKRRCNCIFEDDKMLEDYEYYEVGNESRREDMNLESDKSRTNPYSVRVNSIFEFDYSGKDWRDVPRGFNLYYSPSYEFIKNPKLGTVLHFTLKATTEKLSDEDSLLLLQSVASCVKLEQEKMILENYSNTKNCSTEEDLDREVTPDDVYEIWCEESAFERMIYLNKEVAWRLMDEMLMCNGYRRVLMWFITHMEINHSLVHYIFELVMGLRGQRDDSRNPGDDRLKSLLLQDMMTDKKGSEKVPFSRQGSIILSEIETKMLLQEFFTNAAIFFSTNDTANMSSNDSENVSLYAIGLVKLICFMVKTLMNNDKFDFSKSECTFELQTLLMNWIGIIPEAQELFFTLKANVGEPSMEGKSDSDGTDSNEGELSWYNSKLLALLPSPTNSGLENPAIETLRSFLKKYSFTNKVPVVGRKVIYKDDKILPIPKLYQPILLRELIDENFEEDDDGDILDHENDTVSE